LVNPPCVIADDTFAKRATPTSCAPVLSSCISYDTNRQIKS